MYLGLARHPKLVRGFFVFRVGGFHGTIVQLFQATSRHGGKWLQCRATLGFGFEFHDDGHGQDRLLLAWWSVGPTTVRTVVTVVVWYHSRTTNEGGPNHPGCGRCGGEQQ